MKNLNGFILLIVALCSLSVNSHKDLCRINDDSSNRNKRCAQPSIERKVFLFEYPQKFIPRGKHYPILYNRKGKAYSNPGANVDKIGSYLHKLMKDLTYRNRYKIQKIYVVKTPALPYSKYVPNSYNKHPLKTNILEESNKNLFDSVVKTTVTPFSYLVPFAANKQTSNPLKANILVDNNKSTINSVVKSSIIPYSTYVPFTTYKHTSNPLKTNIFEDSKRDPTDSVVKTTILFHPNYVPNNQHGNHPKPNILGEKNKYLIDFIKHLKNNQRNITQLSNNFNIQLNKSYKDQNLSPKESNKFIALEEEKNLQKFGLKNVSEMDTIFKEEFRAIPEIPNMNQDLSVFIKVY